MMNIKQISKETVSKPKDELCSVLALFEWFTSLMQSNEVSIIDQKKITRRW